MLKDYNDIGKALIAKMPVVIPYYASLGDVTTKH
jgi:hypothetical protein